MRRPWTSALDDDDDDDDAGVARGRPATARSSVHSKQREMIVNMGEKEI